MTIKYRVERERNDHGYGRGWVVLDYRGELVSTHLAHDWALWYAVRLANLAAQR